MSNHRELSFPVPFEVAQPITKRPLRPSASSTPSTLLQALLVSRAPEGSTVFDERNGLGTARPAVVKRAYRFDGLDDRLSGEAINLGTQCTYSQWYYLETDQDTFWGASASDNYFMHWDTTTANVNFGAASPLAVAAPVIGQWVHLVIVRDGNTITQYHNGVEVFSGSATFADDSQVDQFGDPSWTTGGEFKGFTKDWRLFNSALTADQVLYLWQIGTGEGITGTNPGATGLQLHLPCEDKLASFAPDASGNGRNFAKQNITENFHYSDSSIPFSAANREGFTWIPNLDALDDHLQYPGVQMRFDVDSSLEWEHIGSGNLFGDTESANFISAGSDGRIQWSVANDGDTLREFLSATSLGDWVKCRLEYDVSAGELSLYVNDALFETKTGVTNVVDWGASLFAVGTGRSPAVTDPFGGSVRNIVLIQNGVTVIDSPCNDGPGSTTVANNGTGADGTISNADASDFWQELNAETDSTNDLGGTALQFSGEAPANGTLIGSYCGTFDGIDDFLSAPHLTGSETVVSSGGTSVPSVSSGRVDFTAGTCWNLLLSDGTYYPVAEGGGATLHDVSGAGNHGTIVGAITDPGSGLWAARQDDYHYNMLEGFEAYLEDQVMSGATTYDAMGAEASGYTNAQIVFKLTTTDARFIPLWSTNSSRYLLAADVGSSDTTLYANAGSPTLFIDGVEFAGTTRGDLHSALADGVEHEIRLEGVDLSLWDGIRLSGYAGWTLDGTVCDLRINGELLLPTIRVPFASDGSALSPTISGFTNVGSFAGGAWHNNAETAIDPTGGVPAAYPSTWIEFAFNDRRVAPLYSRELSSGSIPVRVDRLTALPSVPTGNDLTLIESYTQNGNL